MYFYDKLTAAQYEYLSDADFLYEMSRINHSRNYEYSITPGHSEKYAMLMEAGKTIISTYRLIRKHFDIREIEISVEETQVIAKAITENYIIGLTFVPDVKVQQGWKYTMTIRMKIDAARECYTEYPLSSTNILSYDMNFPYPNAFINTIHQFMNALFLGE